MTIIKVSLAEKYNSNIKENRLNPFWFTTDHSVHLTSNECPSVKIELEKLSERSVLELYAAFKLGLINIDKPEIFNKVKINNAA